MLETHRLRIRSFRETDREDFVRWHTHPANRAFKWGGLLSVDDAQRAFDWLLENPKSGEYGYRAIELRNTDLAISQIGMFPSEVELSMAIAYLIDEPHWGFGYATEAAVAVAAECRQRHPDRDLIKVIPDGHTASERIATKLGMAPVSREERNGMAVRRWELQVGG